jgi:hypothetical protein
VTCKFTQYLFITWEYYFWIWNWIIILNLNHVTLCVIWLDGTTRDVWFWALVIQITIMMYCMLRAPAAQSPSLSLFISDRRSALHRVLFRRLKYNLMSCRETVAHRGCTNHKPVPYRASRRKYLLCRNIYNFNQTSFEPVYRTDFLWTCWGLNRIERHLEVMYLALTSALSRCARLLRGWNTLPLWGRAQRDKALVSAKRLVRWQ